MFLLLTIFAILISVSSVSATPTVYVNATGGNDANSGTSDSPYQTIYQGISSVDENGTVYIANGVYNGTGNTNITISKSMNITGQSQTGTIINGTGTNWIFNIPSGINVTIQNLTIVNATKNSWGSAISNSGNLTLNGCSFTANTNSNTYPACAGIYNDQSGVLKVVNSNFRDNIAGWSCTILNFGVCTVENSTFINNTATTNGGVIGDAGTLNVTSSTFIGNHADNWGGAIVTDPSSHIEIHYCSLIGNTASMGNVIYNQGYLNATDNWWGSNNPVWTDLIAKVSGTIDTSTWLYMTMNAIPPTINNTQTILVTVSFNNRDNGTTVTSFDPSTGHIPDGTLITYSSTLGNFNPITATTVNGIATSLFTANQSGTDYLYATNDDQTVSRRLTVNQGPTVTTVGGVTGYAGQNVTLTANVDCYGNPVNEGTVRFTVAGNTGSIILNPVPVNNGIAALNWTIPTSFGVGEYLIVADYSGSGNYLASSNGTNLTVTPNPTTIVVGGVSGYAGQNVTFTANLVDSNGNPVTDGQVTFRVNNTNNGTVAVSNGTASITWAIPTTWTAGNYSVVADYSGSNNYLASTNSTLLTLQPSSYLYLNTTTSKKNPTTGETFILTYKLSNSGPDNATNVTVSFQIPAGLEFVNATVDNGTVTYNPTNRTVTWTLTNVEVGDPYLYLTVRALGTGSYTITPTITSETFNGNTDPLMPFSISVKAENNSNSSTVNAASTTKTVPMQTTGMPVAGLVLAILAVLGGTLAPRKK
ncbi:Ig-like domain repeat protein [Methanobacterium aggregans]|uniref:Ig-like domain repeat protein n=1 Tax=Methanobacterium aggregans TaxID=1615586 RepID=UPI001AE977FD|nr:Ig-like domain repeat protein [Methanobacterium aggregans]MBP2045279.1 putative repeat protein (TIGR01451 family) [Methanobacterium aggregans]